LEQADLEQVPAETQALCRGSGRAWGRDNGQESPLLFQSPGQYLARHLLTTATVAGASRGFPQLLNIPHAGIRRLADIGVSYSLADTNIHESNPTK